MTITRGVGNNGFECGQDNCDRRFLNFYFLRKHIKENHLHVVDKSDDDADDVVHYIDSRDGNAFYHDNVDLPEENQDINEDFILEHDNNNNFNLRTIIVRMTARFGSKGSVTETTVTQVLNECE